MKAEATEHPEGAMKPVRRVFGDHTPQVIDLALVMFFAAFGLVDLALDFGDNDTSFSVFAVVVILVACTAILFRRTHAREVLVFVWSARLVLAYFASTEVALSMPSAFALFTFCRQSSRRISVLAALAAAGLAAISILIVRPPSVPEEMVIEVLVALLAAAVAEIMRVNDARTNERVLAESTARVQAERLRLARDLHDVVAHSLSNIAVQSGVASRLIDSDPDHAKKALEIINEAGRHSLDELRSFLGLLRSDDEEIAAAPTPDHPDDIASLIEQQIAGGADIVLRQRGDFPPRASSAIVVAAYRIIQESLTNVARHAGTVPTVVELRHCATHVDVWVRNQSGRSDRPQVPSTGVGIIGMTERAEAVGGRLSTESLADGGFAVHAVLPYDRQEFTTQ